MARLIRRTLTITIHEEWTFVWTPEQTSDSQGAAEEEPLPSPAQLAQQLAKLLGGSIQATKQPGSPIQVFVQSSAKESTDEKTNA